MGQEIEQLFNIRTDQQILMAPGCKSLLEAAAAHVNNNATALSCRTAHDVHRKQEISE